MQFWSIKVLEGAGVISDNGCCLTEKILQKLQVITKVSGVFCCTTCIKYCLVTLNHYWSWDQFCCMSVLLLHSHFHEVGLGFHLSCNRFLWRTYAVSNHIWGAFLRVQKKSARLHLGTDIWLLLSLKKVTSKILPLQLRNRANPLPFDPNTCNQPRRIGNDQNPFLLLLQNKTSQSFSMSWELLFLSTYFEDLHCYKQPVQYSSSLPLCKTAREKTNFPKRSNNRNKKFDFLLKISD